MTGADKYVAATLASKITTAVRAMADARGTANCLSPEVLKELGIPGVAEVLTEALNRISSARRLMTFPEEKREQCEQGRPPATPMPSDGVPRG